MIELWKCFCRSKEPLLGLFKISVGQKLHDLLQYWTIKVHGIDCLSERYEPLPTLKGPFFVLKSLWSLAVAVIGFYLYFQSWLLRRGVKSSPRSCDFLCDVKTISLPGQETRWDMDVELTHSPCSPSVCSIAFYQARWFGRFHFYYRMTELRDPNSLLDLVYLLILASTRFISLKNSIKVVCFPKLQLIFVSLFVDDCIIRKWETIWSRHS